MQAQPVINSVPESTWLRGMTDEQIDEFTIPESDDPEF